MLAHVRIPNFEIMKHLQSPWKQYSTWPNGHGVHNEHENYQLSTWFHHHKQTMW